MKILTVTAMGLMVLGCQQSTEPTSKIAEGAQLYSLENSQVLAIDPSQVKADFRDKPGQQRFEATSEQEILASLPLEKTAVVFAAGHYNLESFETARPYVNNGRVVNDPRPNNHLIDRLENDAVLITTTGEMFIAPVSEAIEYDSQNQPVLDNIGNPIPREEIQDIVVGEDPRYSSKGYGANLMVQYQNQLYLMQSKRLDQQAALDMLKTHLAISPEAVFGKDYRAVGLDPGISLGIFVKSSGAKNFEHHVLQHNSGNLPSPRFFVIQER